MSKGSAIIMTMIAFVGGLLIGNLTGSGGGHDGDEIAAEGELGELPAAAAEARGSEVERFNLPVTDDQPSKGPDTALVTIVEFSEFQCPFCNRVGPTIKQIMDTYGDKVRVVWRHNPLPFHQNAMPAAIAAHEAFVQGGDEKFWAMHDLLFQNQQALAREDLERYAQQVGLDMNKFKAALDNQTHKSVAEADQQLANRVAARGTPHFFINGRRLAGAQPFENFKQIIDDEISRAEKIVAAGVAANQVYAAFMRGAKSEGAEEQPQQPQQARRQPDPNAVYKVPVADEDPQKGPDNALVTIVEFSDFECPFCGRVLPTLKQITDEYGQDVRIIFKQNPLPFHQNAGPAAALTLEAHAQGGDAKFWAAHDLLFENQRALTREDLERYAQQLGLNVNRFKAALDNETYKSRIEADQQLARSLGASGTPAFFINGRNLRGAQPFEAFKRVIDEELAKARAKVEAGTPRARIYEETIKDGHTSPQFIEPPAGAAAPQGAQQPPPDQVYEIAVPRDAPSKGGANAKVVIQQFSDFQCPFCTRVEPTIDQIMEEYGNRVKLVWRNYPLPFHQDAGPAAQAAVEVYRQGGNDKFWAFHGLLFENQRALARADLERYAEQVGGINMAQFRQALDTNRHEAAVKADMDAVTNAGARIGTPSFFINGRLLQGAQPIDAFKAAIDRALAEAR